MADTADRSTIVQVTFRVNGTAHALSSDGDMPLLWVLRERLGLRATKFGCGRGLCGACSVIVNDEVARSCSLPLRFLDGKEVTTLEGLGSPERPHPVQVAWIQEQVPQCGYCQPGFIVAAVNLLRKKPRPTDEDIDRSLTNLCRCGTYERVRRAVHAAARLG
ncbi:MAG TPA: (2Fe-2S)-binding protein [Kofleriaceae bacterium]|nr:(2Fe-2S)-binding protein [Kofleriaceae bacterium]